MIISTKNTAYMGFAVFLAIFIAFIYIIKGGLFYKFCLPYELCLDINIILIYKIGLNFGKNVAEYR